MHPNVKKLDPMQYHVTQEKGTEPAFTGIYVDNKKPGMYKCVVCGQDLFSSDTKFDSGTGWPSFWDSIDKTKIKLHENEVACKSCGAHLGHVFEDGPEDKTSLRYCINSCALNFSPQN